MSAPASTELNVTGVSCRQAIDSCLAGQLNSPLPHNIAIFTVASRSRVEQCPCSVHPALFTSRRLASGAAAGGYGFPCLCTWR